MAKKDPEAAKMAKEQEKAEIKKSVDQIRRFLQKIPPQVINGSHNHAVSFKNAVVKAQKAVSSARQNLHTLKECAADLERFYT